jgi:sigma-E factor negative regulatory protein RseB
VVRFLWVIWLAVTGVAYAGEKVKAKQILEKMLTAMEVSNFQGTVVFLKNDKLEAMKYFHTIDKTREQERLVSLNSPPREIVRNSDEVKCRFKLTGNVIADNRPYQHSFIVDVPKNLDNLDASYSLEVIGEEDVAMIPSYLVAIQPKDNFRYSRKIWVAKEQFLPMKAVVYDASGIALEQVVFTEMQIDKKHADIKTTEAADKAQQPVKAATDLPPQAAFEVTALPQGFRQVFFSRKPLHKSEQPVEHLLLSDGFASVSVYLETKKAGMPPNMYLPYGIHSVGAVNSLSRVLADSQLTVLGEVPAVTVKFIAEGVKLRNSSH